MSTHIFSKKEEIIHAITHGIGAIFSVFALILLIVFSSLEGGALLIMSTTTFGVSMLLMYTSSTVVHSLPMGKMKDIFLIIDHASIYIFIAGSYTPFVLIQLNGTIGWTLFAVVWGLAIIGIILKIFFVKRFLILSTVVYILMGWMIMLAWEPLTFALPTNGIILLVAGGVVYTLGSLFYIIRKIPYHHVIWHVCVLLGSLLHFLTIFIYCI